MATMKWYVKAKKSLANKEADIDTDSIKMALFTNTLAIDQNADQYFDAAPYTSNELATGNGYTTGGVVVGSITVTASTLKFVISGAAASWTFVGTKAFQKAVFYDSSPASNKPVLGSVDLGAQSVTDTTFTINPDATNGYLYDVIS
jgi:hypothetical protein